jgi:hypothetical protein
MEGFGDFGVCFSRFGGKSKGRVWVLEVGLLRFGLVFLGLQSGM